MSERATLEALLARVLEGTGPDRELDGALAEALQVGGNPWKHDGDGWISVHGFGCQAAMFTQSIDAALTLVPVRWAVELVQALSGAPWHTTLRGGSALVPIIGATAATPARALIGACIKARMEAQGE